MSDRLLKGEIPKGQLTVAHLFTSVIRDTALCGLDPVYLAISGPGKNYWDEVVCPRCLLMHRLRDAKR